MYIHIKFTFFKNCNILPLPPGYAPTLSANDTYPGKGNIYYEKIKDNKDYKVKNKAQTSYI